MNKINKDEIQLEKDLQEDIDAKENHLNGDSDGIYNQFEDEFEEKLDMRAVLGYLNQFEWISHINIGNIMQIEPFKIEEFMKFSKNEYQLSRKSFINKIALLAVGYFWASTEIRFILQLNEDPTFKKNEKELEAEYWHSKKFRNCLILFTKWLTFSQSYFSKLSEASFSSSTKNFRR